MIYGSHDHYDLPIVTYDWMKKHPLVIDNEAFLISNEFTFAVVSLLRNCDYSKDRKIENPYFGFTTSRKDSCEYIHSFNIGRVPVMFAPQAFTFEYRISPHNEDIISCIYYNISRKLHHTTIKNRVDLIIREEEAEKMRSLYGGWNSKLEQEYKSRHRHNYDLPFDIQFLESKFNVRCDFTSKDVYIFYEDEVCLVISPGWIRIFPDNIVTQFGLTKYNQFELKQGFANVIVKILNNR